MYHSSSLKFHGYTFAIQYITGSNKIRTPTSTPKNITNTIAVSINLR